MSRLGRKTHSFKESYSDGNAETRAQLGGESEARCFSIVYGEVHFLVVAAKCAAYSDAATRLQHPSNTSRTKGGRKSRQHLRPCVYMFVLLLYCL